MRYILLIVLLVQSVSSYSQFFVGYSKRGVKSALLAQNVKFTENKLTDTTSRIAWSFNGENEAIVVFNREDSSTLQTIAPESDKAINGLIRRFNKDYVPISDTEWKAYVKGKIYKIVLSYLLDIGIFTITLVPTGI